MGQAKVIALDDVRASHQRQALRHQLHERFDRWLVDAWSYITSEKGYRAVIPVFAV